ncbi:MAG: hypothetical protein Q7V01_11280 [Vicinamibacterales bacterium]|nr:hypothetical protein [Vicinamibacterales bacterium]
MQVPAREPATRSPFGDVVILLFLFAQAADGALTYLGVHTMGLGIEANPLLVALMVSIGAAPALLSAKVFAAVLGISLHIIGVHRVVACLTAFYMGGAVLPWIGVFITH